MMYRQFVNFTVYGNFHQIIRNIHHGNIITAHQHQSSKHLQKKPNQKWVFSELFVRIFQDSYLALI